MLFNQDIYSVLEFILYRNILYLIPTCTGNPVYAGVTNDLNNPIYEWNAI